MKPTEEYVVKFWAKNPDTDLAEQHEETVLLHSKGKHRHAERQIIAKYKSLGQMIKIVSVIYQ